MKRILPLLLLLVMFQLGQSQQNITIQDLEVTSPTVDFMSGAKGTEISFDLLFSTQITNYSASSFDLDFVLVTKTGDLVFDSRDHKLSVRVQAYANSKPEIKAAMIDSNVELFAPSKFIKLPTGTHELILIMSLKNDFASIDNFYKGDITIKHEFIEEKTFEQQEFFVDKPTFNFKAKGFGMQDPGMDVNFKVGIKYGANQVSTKKYELNLKIFSPDGSKLLYQSSSATSIHHKQRSFSTDITAGNKSTVSYWVNYVELKMNQAGEALVVIEAEHPGVGKREIYREKHFLNTPTKYYFKDQSFTLKNLRSDTLRVDGVAGLGITFDVTYKYTTPLIDPETGDFNFAVVLHENGKDTVFSPAWIKRLDYSTTSAWDGKNPLHDTLGSKVHLFVPFHRMKLTEGLHTVQYTILVSDLGRKHRFPPLQTGTVSFHQPKRYKYVFDVTYLSVISGNYDTQVAMFGSLLPDLQWRLQVGLDSEFISYTGENSLQAPTGTATVSMCEGDRVSIGLWDIDSGFFNNDDILGRWEIPTKNRGESFTHEASNQGVISMMTVKVTRK